MSGSLFMCVFVSLQMCVAFFSRVYGTLLMCVGDSFDVCIGLLTWVRSLLMFFRVSFEVCRSLLTYSVYLRASWSRQWRNRCILFRRVVIFKSQSAAEFATDDVYRVD